MPRLSVIIPTLNEAHHITALLTALNTQSRLPDEVIVADAGSSDGTPHLAEAHHARVVPGGRPGPGRNAGARAATGDLFLFLDADVLPEAQFIALMLEQFERAGLEVATCLIKPLGDAPGDWIITEATNVYLQVVQHFSPHAPGFCILARRAVHEAIQGFDETVKLAEDHDYVQRAAKVGRFGVIARAYIPVSMRRLEKEGLPQLALKYMWCELHALAGKRIYSTPFEYEFGTHPLTPAPNTQRVVDVAQLREQLGRFDNPLKQLSGHSLSGLNTLIKRERDEMRERFKLALEAPDASTLRRYLARRLAVLRRAAHPLDEALAKLQTHPLRESIRLLEANWLQLRAPQNAAPEKLPPPDESSAPPA